MVLKKMNNEIALVILAAGKGMRMLPLTAQKPKPLQEVCGKNLIEWKLETLPDLVGRIVMVIGYEGDQIRSYFGNAWRGRAIDYVVQEKLNGTGGALWAARSILPARFMVMMGDDLYGRADVSNLLQHDYALGVIPVFDREIGGAVTVNPDGTLNEVSEGRRYVSKGLLNTGLYMLRDSIFSVSLCPALNGSDEYGLPQTIVEFARTHPVSVVSLNEWMQITAPHDLKRAEEFVSPKKV